MSFFFLVMTLQMGLNIVALYSTRSNIEYNILIEFL